MIKFMKNKGFTLIELVIVMTLVGILVAIAVPQFQNLAPTARGNVDKNTLGVVRSAINLFIVDPANTTNASPTIDDLVADITPAPTVSNDGTNDVGLDFTRDNGTTLTVYTFTNNACSTGTTDATTDEVVCVSLTP